MGADLRILPAQDWHAFVMAPGMRQLDALEMKASCGLEPLEGLRYAIGVSSSAWAAISDDDILAIFGVVPLNVLAGEASVWCLTSEGVNDLPFAFLRKSKQVVAELLSAWSVLVNMVDVRHGPALRWLRWLGAEVHAPVPHGPEGLPFCPIVFRRSELCVHHS